MTFGSPLVFPHPAPETHKNRCLPALLIVAHVLTKSITKRLRRAPLRYAVLTLLRARAPPSASSAGDRKYRSRNALFLQGGFP
jgi:hypothetical protein